MKRQFASEVLSSPLDQSLATLSEQAEAYTGERLFLQSSEQIMRARGSINELSALRANYKRLEDKASCEPS